MLVLLESGFTQSPRMDNFVLNRILRRELTLQSVVFISTIYLWFMVYTGIMLIYRYKKSMRTNESQLIISTFKTNNKDCEGNTRDLSPPISFNIPCHSDSPPRGRCSSCRAPSSYLESGRLQSELPLSNL